MNLFLAVLTEQSVMARGSRRLHDETKGGAGAGAGHVYAELGTSDVERMKRRLEMNDVIGPKCDA